MDVRVLVLDGPGAVGRAITTELAGTGVSAVLAGPDPDRYEQRLRLRGDLGDLYRAAGRVAVVVDASGREDPRVVERATAAGAAFVEVGASSSYLSTLAGLTTGTPVLAGARLIPVLAALLSRDVAAHGGSPGETPVDVAVVLGAGDPESAADTGSTYALMGHTSPDPATGAEIPNFGPRQPITLPDGSVRTMTRVNYPDQQTLTAALGRPVRTWFATGDRLSTALLRGLARVRRADRLPSTFHFPGTVGWQVVARSGDAVSWARGQRQVAYTAHVAALAARRAPTVEPHLHRIADLLSLADLGELEGLETGRSRLGVPQS